MKKVILGKLTKECHFPKIQPIVQENPKGFFRKMKLFFTFRRKFYVLEDYIVWSEYLQEWIFIPANFIFDGASVPKILNSLYQSTGMLFFGASVHDFGYRYKLLIHVDKITGSVFLRKYTKKELDKIFDHLCTFESGLPTASKGATLGLTLFGWLGWNENRKNEKSLYRDFPEIFV